MSGANDLTGNNFWLKAGSEALPAFILKLYDVAIQLAQVRQRGSARVIQAVAVAMPVSASARVIQAVAVAMSVSALPRQAAAEALARWSGQERAPNHLAREWRDEELAILDIPTPHGPIMKELHVGGRTVKVTDPRALMWLEMRVCPSYQAFLCQHLPAGASKVGIYMDDVRPGNQHRPDSGRLYYAFYIVLLSLPSWWRHSEWGWYDLAFVLKKDVDKIDGGMGALTDQLMAFLDFPMTVAFPFDVIPGMVSLSLQFLLFVADQKALQAMLALKGASSYHPCGCCANVLGRIPSHAVTAPFIHLTCAEADRFDLFTYERFQQCCMEVRNAWNRSPQEGAAMEMQLGIVWNRGRNVLFSARAPVFRVPESLCWDAQHSIWSSGGVGQYVCNQFIHDLTANGLNIPQIDDFIRYVVHPRGEKWKAPLSERIRPGNNKHIRAFAGETVLLITSLTMLCEMVIVPTGQLPGQRLLIQFLFTIQCLILMSDFALPHMDLLDELLEEFHKLFLHFYGACAKPKLHYMRHLARLYKAFGHVITCFSAERHHRASKSIAAFSFNRMTSTLQDRMVMRRLEHFRTMENTSWAAAKLGKNQSLPTGRMRARFRPLLHDIGWRGTARSRNMRTAVCWFTARDFILCSHDEAPAGDVPWIGCRAIEFWSAAQGAATDHFMVAERYELGFAPDDAGTTWLYRRTRAHIILHHTRLFFAASYVAEGDEARVLLPMYARRIFT